MTTVPNSFSMDELSKAMEDAPKEDELQAQVNNKEYTQEYVENAASDAINFAENLVANPLVHKVMAMMIINRMVIWHSSVAERMIKDGNNESAICWARDAGKFQSMLDSLTEICITDDDFTCIHNIED